MEKASSEAVLSIIWISGLFILGLVLFIIIFFLLYQGRLLRQHEAMRRLELARQTERMAALVEGQENERKRVAHDLHDGVGAMLTTIRMGLWSLERKTPADGGQAAELRGWVDEAIENVRAAARDLMPPTLARTGLGDAITQLAERAGQSVPTQISADIQLGGKRCAELAEIHIYRIVQELMNNSLRHSRSQHIQIVLTANAGDMDLHYQDDGDGFDPHALAMGLGIKSIESRVALLGAQMDMASAPGKGMSCRIYLPLDPPTEVGLSAPSV